MKRMWLAAVIVVGMVLPAAAGVYTHPEGGLSIWFPDNWQVKPQENVLEADAPGGEAYVQLMMLDDAESLDAAVDSLVQELDPIIQDFQTTSDGEEITANGLKFFVVEGTGMVEGVKMEVSVALIGTRKGKIAMMLLFCPEVFAQKYEQDFNRIVQNIKAM